ncbi:hypothetical protein AAG570_012103 [Ranatra chinensis]|uniref:Uncharacterized protein n=1 Tax=Ranatra chinensis TaxID=642074 RepID=A0ABD0YI05_9HEMI
MASKRRNMFYETKNPGYYLTQTISGRGNFAAKLAGFDLKDEDHSTCGVPETLGHVLLECRNRMGILCLSFVEMLAGGHRGRVVLQEGNVSVSLRPHGGELPKRGSGRRWPTT